MPETTTHIDRRRQPQSAIQAVKAALGPGTGTHSAKWLFDWVLRHRFSEISLMNKGTLPFNLINTVACNADKSRLCRNGKRPQYIIKDTDTNLWLRSSGIIPGLGIPKEDKNNDIGRGFINLGTGPEEIQGGR